MRCLILLISSIAPLAAQPSVKDFGALGDGIADDSAAFARAIKSLEGLGGALRIPKGTYNLGTTGITIPKTFGGIRLFGDSATSSRLVYTGAGAAVTIGAPSGATYGHTLSDLHIDITKAQPDAICVKLHPSLYVSLTRLYLTTSNAFPAAINHQMGIVAEGGAAAGKLFGAYLRIEDPRINGRFRKGIYLTAPDIGWGYNSCTIQGGAVVYQGAPEEGTIGIHIEQGNQNLFSMVDVEQFATGIQSEAYANTFVATRTEGNLAGLVLAAPSAKATGGAHNKVLGAFHEDGLVDLSPGSQILATAGSK